MKKPIIIIGLIVALAAAAGLYALSRGGSDQNTNNTSGESVTDGTITYTDSGFSPTTITIAAGETITVLNNSSEELDFSSDEHPVHTDNPELNLRTLAVGESINVTLSEAGTWGYHNHLDPDKTGTIIVE